MKILPARRRAANRDDGVATIEVAILGPALLILITLAILAMRIEIAGEAVDTSAHDAARAASISRNGTDAQAAALAAARTTLSADGLSCASLTVTVDTSQFSRPIGQQAAVTATVTCDVDLARLAIPGLPGDKVITSTFTSEIDRYGGRS
jgi:Flp pilus assembly protein TadG